MAEFLVKDHIPASYINSIYTANKNLKDELDDLVRSYGKSCILDKKKFFLPNTTHKINDKISLVDGDMFFSIAQTLTISVNTVGIMGKGLASRTRYQFPDVFVEYQDLCRSRKITMGKPYLIKREKNIDELLAYNPETLKNKNSSKWFLLFPTKTHWRQDSDIQGIEKGLQWLVKNYKKENITSIALPALGCGLGKLSWKHIGPLMCKYLNTINIPSRIYLPQESEIPAEQLSTGFLLQK